MKCQRCNTEMEFGFMYGIQPLRFMSSETVLKFIHSDGDCDVRTVPLWKKILPSKATYIQAHRCSSCENLLIEYGKDYSLEDVREMTAANF